MNNNKSYLISWQAVFHTNEIQKRLGKQNIQEILNAFPKLPLLFVKRA